MMSLFSRMYNLILLLLLLEGILEWHGTGKRSSSEGATFSFMQNSAQVVWDPTMRYLMNCVGRRDLLLIETGPDVDQGTSNGVANPSLVPRLQT